jgi:hypothetical protein
VRKDGVYFAVLVRNLMNSSSSLIAYVPLEAV